MSNSTRSTAAASTRTGSRQFVTYTLISAIVAATAAGVSTALGFQAWVMFAGFIAWFTRPMPTRNGVFAVLCLWLGLGIGIAAHSATYALTPVLGGLALPLVVFVSAIIIVGLRTTAVVDNMLGWFLGLVTFFAAHIEVAPGPLFSLLAASAIGGLAGWACVALTHRFAPVH